MKKQFAILGVTLALTQTICLGGTGEFAAFAEDGTADTPQSTVVCIGDPGYGLPTPSLEQQLEEFLNNPDLTEDQKRDAKEKVETAIFFRDSAVPDNAGSDIQNRSYSTVTLSVPAYTQEEDYYCGPATTRQTLGYLGMVVPGGYNPPTQSTIAAAVYTTTSGTEWNYITAYINSFTFMGISNNYFAYTPSSKNNMESVINSALTQTHPTPPILQINTNGYSSTMGYSTSGHYMNVSGIKTESGTNYFQITDPNRGRLSPALSSKYYMTTSYAWTITQNHWAQHFLY